MHASPKTQYIHIYTNLYMHIPRFNGLYKCWMPRIQQLSLENTWLGSSLCHICHSGFLEYVSLCVQPPFVFSLPLCSALCSASLCVQPPFVFSVPLCSASLCVQHPFVFSVPLCSASLCVQRLKSLSCSVCLYIMRVLPCFVMQDRLGLFYTNDQGKSVCKRTSSLYDVIKHA